MISPASPARIQLRSHIRLGAVVVLLLNVPTAVNAQGLVKGVQQGAQAGNRAAGPVGGVLGGAIGGVVGVFTGVLGAGRSESPAGDSGTERDKQPIRPKRPRPAKVQRQASRRY